jgi:hypothetical protein
MRHLRQHQACVVPAAAVNRHAAIGPVARGAAVLLPGHRHSPTKPALPLHGNAGEVQVSQGPLGIVRPQASGAYFSQASTLSGLALIHLSEAFSGDMPSAVMYFATRFWSLSDQVKFLISR